MENEEGCAWRGMCDQLVLPWKYLRPRSGVSLEDLAPLGESEAAGRSQGEGTEGQSLVLLGCPSLRTRKERCSRAVGSLPGRERRLVSSVRTSYASCPLPSHRRTPSGTRGSPASTQQRSGAFPTSARLAGGAGEARVCGWRAGGAPTLRTSCLGGVTSEGRAGGGYQSPANGAVCWPPGWGQGCFQHPTSTPTPENGKMQPPSAIGDE